MVSLRNVSVLLSFDFRTSVYVSSRRVFIFRLSSPLPLPPSPIFRSPSDGLVEKAKDKLHVGSSSNDNDTSYGNNNVDNSPSGDYNVDNSPSGDYSSSDTNTGGRDFNSGY